MPKRVHNLEIEVGRNGELRLVIDCPHTPQKDAVVYDREGALRMLAELEAEIRKSSPKRPD